MMLKKLKILASALPLGFAAAGASAANSTDVNDGNGNCVAVTFVAWESFDYAGVHDIPFLRNGESQGTSSRGFYFMPSATGYGYSIAPQGITYGGTASCSDGIITYDGYYPGWLAEVWETSGYVPDSPRYPYY